MNGFWIFNSPTCTQKKIHSTGAKLTRNTIKIMRNRWKLPSKRINIKIHTCIITPHWTSEWMEWNHSGLCALSAELISTCLLHGDSFSKINNERTKLLTQKVIRWSYFLPKIEQYINNFISSPHTIHNSTLYLHACRNK